MKKHWTVLGALLLMTVTLLAACDKKVMFVGSSSNTGNKIAASYRVFTGTEVKKVNLKSGDTLAIDYQSEVEKGELTINLYDPDNQLLQGLSTNESGNETIEADKDGSYRLESSVNKTRGSYKIKNEVESAGSK